MHGTNPDASFQDCKYVATSECYTWTNGDGQPDLVTTNYFASSVTVLTNKTFAARAATPAIAPGAGTYIGAVTVTMSDATAGAAIHYTTDGTTPTGASPVYTGPIVLGPLTTTTINAIAVAPGQSQSVVASATYTVVL